MIDFRSCAYVYVTIILFLFPNFDINLILLFLIKVLKIKQ